MLGKVEGFYQLIEGAECKEQVKALCEDTSYIFPTKVCSISLPLALDFDLILSQDGEIISNKPFHHPALISTLCNVYFTSTRGSHAEHYSAHFSSSITVGPHKYECELPDAMVALAATGVSNFFLHHIYTITHLFSKVHLSLDDYSSGVCQKTEFMADLYKNVYIGHITFLNNIKEESPDRYH